MNQGNAQRNLYYLCATVFQLVLFHPNMWKILHIKSKTLNFNFNSSINSSNFLK